LTPRALLPLRILAEDRGAGRDFRFLEGVDIGALVAVLDGE